jgi:3-deoxy-manno-octulosonate cytidylyltransferase (CMP-KDO synthetase)
MKKAQMKISAVIPARYASTRFEGKPLADILGRPMIQYVYEGVRQSKLIDEVIVATDDQRILEAVKSFGGNAVITSPTHSTGTGPFSLTTRSSCPLSSRGLRR